MKFVTIALDNEKIACILVNNTIYNLQAIDDKLPKNLINILSSDFYTKKCKEIFNEIIVGQHKKHIVYNPHLLAAIPHPTSFRDAYAFRQHVETSRLNRGLPMIPEFDQFPVFYFSNHQAIVGPGEINVMPEHLNKLDFELEIAIVIKKEGINIKAKDADEYIGGYMILNDISARELQMQEMKLNLGPAKGKDFATALGPILTTPEELIPYLVKSKNNQVGNCYNLQMKCFVNDIQVSEGNFSDIHWTFAEIIERISYGTKIFPGDIIGSGTVGTGCFLELNGTGKRQNKNYNEQWLKDGDTIKIEIDELGSLINSIHLYNN